MLNITRWILLSAAGLTAPGFRSVDRQDPNAATAFVNVNVVPMDRQQVLEGQTVIVQGDRILRIGPAATTDVPTGAIRIDGQGKYLLPGLSDLHAHLRENEADNVAQFRLFLETIRKGGTPLIPLASIINTTEAAIAATESSVSNSWIPVQQLT